MSYNVYIKEQKFRIAANKKKAALDALKKSGVAVNAGTISLEGALEDLGWSLDVILQKKYKNGKKRKTKGAGDIVSLYFDREHLTDTVEDTLDAIAPFVDAGSYMEFEGEDMCVWRYLFDGEKVEEIYPTVDWMRPLLVHTTEKEYRMLPDVREVTIGASGVKITITEYSVKVQEGDCVTYQHIR